MHFSVLKESQFYLTAIFSSHSDFLIYFILLNNNTYFLQVVPNHFTNKKRYSKVAGQRYWQKMVFLSLSFNKVKLFLNTLEFNLSIICLRF